MHTMHSSARSILQSYQKGKSSKLEVNVNEVDVRMLRMAYRGTHVVALYGWNISKSAN